MVLAVVGGLELLFDKAGIFFSRPDEDDSLEVHHFLTAGIIDPVHQEHLPAQDLALREDHGDDGRGGAVKQQNLHAGKVLDHAQDVGVHRIGDGHGRTDLKRSASQKQPFTRHPEGSAGFLL